MQTVRSPRRTDARRRLTLDAATGAAVACGTVIVILSTAMLVTIAAHGPTVLPAPTAQTAPATPATPPQAAPAAAHGSEHQIVSSQALTWTEPPSLPPGARLAVIHGDPAKEGAFTIRLKFPDGFRGPPHWHPTDEHLTVLAGTFLIAQGEKFDAAALKPIATGDYAFMPKEMRHFGMAQGETIIQVSGMGPFRVNYVNPEDDPRNKKTSAKD